MIATLILALALAQQGRTTIGIHGSWAAFRDSSPRRCYAIARPIDSTENAPFASIATWPGERLHNQLHIRLSRARHPRARVTLSVGERRFELVAGDADAWSPDARTDVAVVAAIRSGRSMSVESISATGRPFADTYALKGAATAIDAAALGCA